MPSRQAKLVELLIRKQDEGKLSWEQTEKQRQFQVAFPEYAVRISERRESGSDDIFISIYNEDGALLEEFSDVHVQRDMRDSFTIMKQLYESARRAALGVDKALDALIDELADL